MFPNPQDALPLPSRPSLEGYKKIAKDLVKACKSGDAEKIGEWADDWVGSMLSRASFAKTKIVRHKNKWTKPCDTRANTDKMKSSNIC